MSITDELRKSFDQCTFKVGIAPNEFDTVWITKSCALSMLDDIDAAFEAGHERAFEHGKRMGRGTCRRLRHDGDAVFQYCSECGGMLARWLDYDDGNAHFCPNCGRKVVDE